MAVASLRYAMLMAMVLACRTGAAAPPAFVYLASDQTPDAIFINGFAAPGTNDDVMAHVNGQTCASGETAFVSTTALEAFAHERALHLMRTDPNAVAYVYRIRADGNFYSAVASLSAERYRGAFPELLAAAQRSRDQEEWLVHRGVAPPLVHSAQAYRRDPLTGRIVFHGESTNPNYLEASTTASNATYPILAISDDSRRFLVPSFSLPGVSACFSCTGGQAPARKRRYATQQAWMERCGAFVVARDDQPEKVIDPVSGKAVKRYVPWKTWRRTSGYASHEAPERCNVMPGSRDSPDVMIVDCARLEGAKQFRVHLGAGGSAYTWIDKWYEDGLVRDRWVMRASQIPVQATRYMLDDYSWSIYDVFSGISSSWWSGITVLPVYPVLAQPLNDICLHKGLGFTEASTCIRWNASIPSLVRQIDNQISSISAANGQRYRVCDGANFRGKCVVLSGDTDGVTLKRIGMNDTISSIRACLKPAPNVWQAPPLNRGVIGSIFAFDNPASGRREFFRLLRSSYGPFPGNPKRGSPDWVGQSGYDEC